MSLMKIAGNYEYRKLTDNERKAVWARDTERMNNWRIPNGAIAASAYGTMGYMFSRGLPKPAQLAVTGLGALAGVGIVEYSTRKGMAKRKQLLKDKNATFYYNKENQRAILKPRIEDVFI